MSSVYGWSGQGRYSWDFAGPHHPAFVCLPGHCYCWTNTRFKLSRGQVETQTGSAPVAWGVHYLWTVLKCLPDLPFQLTEQLDWLTPQEADTVLRQAPSRRDKVRGVWNSKASNSAWGQRSSLPSQGGLWPRVSPVPRCVRKKKSAERWVFLSQPRALTLHLPHLEHVPKHDEFEWNYGFLTPPPSFFSLSTKFCTLPSRLPVPHFLWLVTLNKVIHIKL